MILKNYHNIYFIGIGGIGMSALARWFNANGHFVAGYDRTETVLTKHLQSEGIDIHFEDNEKLLPESIVAKKENTLVVYTPAIPNSHAEYTHFKTVGYTLLKRSEVLGEITKLHFTIAVAGTHGKTTISSMIAHILKSSGRNCTAFVGGIMTNYNSNVLIGNCEKDCIMVVEADEFDRSFLTIYPNMAIVTSVDADHLDIYGTKKNLKNTFRQFIDNIKKNGRLFIEKVTSDDLRIKKLKNINISSYGLSMGDVQTNHIKAENGAMVFDYKGKNEIKNLKLFVPGLHNVENAIAAISVANFIGCNDDEIINGIETYKGVKRRFEYIIKSDQLVYIDDYAHHPEEINSLLSSIRMLYPESKMTIVFQPHLYSRTRDFAKEFSDSLSKSDEVILLDIYPARELPIEGVNAEMILENIEVEQKEICRKEHLIELLKGKKMDVLLTLGAGDIDTLVQPIKETFFELTNK